MPETKPPPPDPMEAWISITRNLGRAQAAIADYVERSRNGNGFTIPDSGVVGDTFAEAWLHLLANPKQLAEAQLDFLRRQNELWQMAGRRLAGEPVTPVAEPPKGDKRFADEEWTREAAFDVIKQAYLTTADWVQTTMRNVDGLDPHTHQKLDFFTRLAVDAWAPSNFLLTNPKALRATIESGGRNLLDGLEHFVTDLERGHGALSISMTDYDAFELGRNVATTPGKVVFQNDLMQLIQYAPATETVFRRPLLIVPPWINKFYILDLRAKNSFIKWCVDQGLTVFVISWVNPDQSLSHKTFDDYMLEGPLAALEAIRQATGEASVNIVGYCIGGTLTACTLAYMAARRMRGVASATYLVALTDFAEAGEVKVFIDEHQLDLLDEHMAQRGYLEGRHMAGVFNLMRDNDLIWSFAINNYLLGKEPLPFDLLYWNADSTRMPVMMHSFYLRRMYLENKLVEPGGISLAGTSIDLRRIRTPTYMLSAADDHIAPWKATYAATGVYSGPVKFVLAASGHIAGVVNPPSANKYSYWTNRDLPADPDAWLAGAAQRLGSWWPDWLDWLKPHAGPQVPARQPAAGGLPAIEDAPGSYVKLRLAE